MGDHLPVRFLRPGIRSSVRFNAVDWFTQCFYTRLITMVDDFGRYEAIPLLLKSEAFPLCEKVTIKQIENSCEQMSANALAVFYEVDGKKYLQILKWQERPRAEVSKYPEFIADSPLCKQLFASASKCSLPSSSSSSSPTAHAANVCIWEIPENLRTKPFETTWPEWVAYRKPLGKCKDWPRLWRNQLAQLSEWGEPRASAALKYTMRQGWTGIFEEKNGAQEKRKQPMGPKGVML